jgi:hypothetical protein
VTRVLRGPLLVLKWLGVLVGVLGWLLVVPIVEVGRSVARSVARALPGRSASRTAPPEEPTTELRESAEPQRLREASRRAGSM